MVSQTICTITWLLNLVLVIWSSPFCYQIVKCDDPIDENIQTSSSISIKLCKKQSNILDNQHSWNIWTLRTNILWTSFVNYPVQNKMCTFTCAIQTNSYKWNVLKRTDDYLLWNLKIYSKPSQVVIHSTNLQPCCISISISQRCWLSKTCKLHWLHFTTCTAQGSVFLRKSQRVFVQLVLAFIRYWSKV